MVTVMVGTFVVTVMVGTVVVTVMVGTFVVTVMVGTVETAMVGSRTNCLCNIHCYNRQVCILHHAAHQRVDSSVPDILCLIYAVSQERVGSHLLLLALQQYN